MRPVRYNILPDPPRETYDFPQGFAGGMNLSTSPDQIAPNESPDMLNMNYDDGGVPTKRRGWTRLNAVSWGPAPIRGMTKFNGVRVVAWNGKLWSVAPDGTKTDLCAGAKTGIADAPVTFFVMNDKLFCLTGSDYVYWDGVHPVADVQGYVPTITLGRAPTGGGTPNEALNYLSDSWIDSFSCDSTQATATEFKLSFPADSVIAKVNGVQVSVTHTPGSDTVVFSTPPGQGTNHVTIQGTKAGLMDRTKITKCTIAAIYGGKTDTRVFLAGNPDLKNWRFMSGLMDPTYWPEDGFDAIGSDADAIVGFGRMIDYLIIYKEHGSFYSYIEGPDSAGNVTFPVLPLNDEHDFLAPRTIKPAQGGLLALSREGVTWTIPSLVRGQLNTIVVSRKINKGVKAGLLDNTLDDLRNAHAEVWDNKYLLRAGNKTWVLDLRYSDLARGVFCWYPYDGVFAGAGCFFVDDDTEELYIGDRAEGIIYKPQNRYLDDGTAIDAYWTSPLVFGGRRDWVKRWERLNTTFAGQPAGNHVLSIITDQGVEEVAVVIQNSTVFGYDLIDYSAWTYGVPFYPAAQSEKVGYNSEYLQWKWRNNAPDEGMTILGQTLLYTLQKRVK